MQKLPKHKNKHKHKKHSPPPSTSPSPSPRPLQPEPQPRHNQCIHYLFGEIQSYKLHHDTKTKVKGKAKGNANTSHGSCLLTVKLNPVYVMNELGDRLEIASFPMDTADATTTSDDKREDSRDGHNEDAREDVYVMTATQASSSLQSIPPSRTHSTNQMAYCPIPAKSSVEIYSSSQMHEEMHSLLYAITNIFTSKYNQGKRQKALLLIANSKCRRGVMACMDPRHQNHAEWMPVSCDIDKCLVQVRVQPGDERMVVEDDKEKEEKEESKLHSLRSEQKHSEPRGGMVRRTGGTKRVFIDVDQNDHNYDDDDDDKQAKAMDKAMGKVEKKIEDKEERIWNTDKAVQTKVANNLYHLVNMLDEELAKF